MGGKALKNTYTERKSLEDFNRISNEIIPIVEKQLGTDVYLTKSYHNKLDFGDMDLLIKMKLGISNVLDFIKNKFNPNEIYQNGQVISFDYNSFQIDFILIGERNWETSKIYFDYDPTGNLMGKIAHKFNCKYGDRGLIYRYRHNSGRVFENILLSTDNKEIFTFLGFDYDRFIKGFDSLEDIFNFVIDSKYFDYSDMLMENLNHIDRKRNVKRDSYQKFLLYLNDNNIQKTVRIDKDNIFNIVNEFFPNVNMVERIEELKKNEDNNILIKQKFNGRLILKAYPNMNHIELGKNMMNFRRGMEDFDNFVLNNTIEKIIDDFIFFYENTK